MISDRPPTPPSRLHDIAREILAELRDQPAAAALILGGGVALQHYCEYRDTKDIDAWWNPAPTQATESLLLDAMQKIAHRRGYSFAVRHWGDTQSYELQEQGRTIFSFQVAVRSVALDPPQPSSWPPLQIETLLDNLGSKMNALVGRGAPRDFLDLFTVVERGLATPTELWAAWARKNPVAEETPAKVKVLQRLQELEARRPLASIADPLERESAGHVRQWVRDTLCRDGERP